MLIDASKPKILERPGAQRIEHALLGGGGIDFAARHLLDEGVKLGGIHRRGAGGCFIDLFSNPTVT